MTKGLRSFPENERQRIAKRRINSKERGLGYWGAVDYANKNKSRMDTSDLMDIEDESERRNHGKPKHRKNTKRTSKAETANQT